ncbi:MAG: 3-deoxy-manno-octulosonate cytidylyltransferase (CMP-KDO synthetase) [bacterium]|jgi:3-deoxy-manno-octulosonate cytidylyltransferase (CMP-KDO synthetase)
MKSIVIIPSRLGSTRLPNKPLMKIQGKTMIRLTIEKVLASGLSPIVIATDSDLIFKECEGIEGVIPVMTSPDHACGTDRVYEAYQIVAKDLGEFDVVINVQGDEPFIQPELLRSVSEELPKRTHAEFWTTVTPIQESELDDENVAKVVLNKQEDALIFTRSAIGNAFKHTSIYVYTPAFLAKFCSMEPSPLEKGYRLEQMRALDNGLTLNCIPLPYDSISINTVEDLEKAGIQDYEIFEN